MCTFNQQMVDGTCFSCPSDRPFSYETDVAFSACLPCNTEGFLKDVSFVYVQIAYQSACQPKKVPAKINFIQIENFTNFYTPLEMPVAPKEESYKKIYVVAFIIPEALQALSCGLCCVLASQSCFHGAQGVLATRCTQRKQSKFKKRSQSSSNSNSNSRSQQLNQRKQTSFNIVNLRVRIGILMLMKARKRLKIKLERRKILSK